MYIIEDNDPMNEQRLKNYAEKGIYATDAEITESNKTIAMFGYAFIAIVVAFVLVAISN